MELTIKAMFDLMPKGAPLPYGVCAFPVDYSNGRVRCPNMADAINDLGVSVVVSGLPVTDALNIGVNGASDSMPNDSSSVFWRGATEKSQKDNGIFHARIILQKTSN